MVKFILMFLAISSFSFAEEGENNVGVIITNYEYDQWGRLRGRRSYPYPSNPGYYPYGGYNPYYYQTENLPGADPDRFEEIFEQNSRR